MTSRPSQPDLVRPPADTTARLHALYLVCPRTPGLKTTTFPVSSCANSHDTSLERAWAGAVSEVLDCS